MRWPLTGRDAELRLIAGALAGGSTGGVVISGHADVGKTRLATEAAELAAAQGCVIEWVRSSRSAGSIPLAPFATVLPAGDRLPEGVELLARTRRALAEQPPAAGSCCASTTGSSSTTRPPRWCTRSSPSARPSRW